MVRKDFLLSDCRAGSRKLLESRKKRLCEWREWGGGLMVWVSGELGSFVVVQSLRCV